MIVGFTGTQEGLTAVQAQAVAEVLKELNATEGRHGDCIGGDAQFHAACVALGVPVVIHPPSDPKKREYCEGAREVLAERPYLDRNKDIVDAAEVLIAGPKEMEGESHRSGTWSTARYARRKGKRVIVLRPDGRRTEG